MQAKTKKNIINNISCWVMGLVPLVGFVLFGVIPMIISLYLSFTELHGFDYRMAKFIGMGSYVTVFKDPLFHKAIVNTLYSLISVPLPIILGLLVAGILNNKKVRGKKFFSTLFFCPYVCSSVAIATVFGWMFDIEFGVFNSLITALGGEKSKFFSDPHLFMPLMIFMMTWCGFGCNVMMFQAALTNLNQSVLEAAEIDGAGPVKKFFHVTMPAISPTTFFMLTTGIIGGLQTFTWFQVMSARLTGTGYMYGPENRGLTLVFYLYKQAFEYPFSEGMGLACATSWIVALGVAAITALNFKLSKKWVYYDD